MRETKSDEQYCTLTNTNFTKWVGFFPLVLNVFLQFVRTMILKG